MLQKWILYSTCDEDADSEMKALSLSPADDVLSVTGSGCRSLSLLSMDPASLSTIDYSIGQNFIFELKLAAIRALSYGDLLNFLGVRNEGMERKDAFFALKYRMSDEAWVYFKNNIRKIEDGILFQGRHEQFYVKIMSPVFKALYGQSIEKIFNSETLVEQREIFRKEIKGPLYDLIISKGFNKTLLKLILNDKRYDVNVEVEDLGRYMLETLDYAFCNHLAKESDWLTFMFTGKYDEKNALPHFLKEDVVQRIRRCKTKISIVNENIVDYSREMQIEKFNKFSLSDITSCLSRSDFMTVLKNISSRGRGNGRLCFRNFITNYSVRDTGGATLERDDEMSSFLNKKDRAFSYRFEVATIVGKQKIGSGYEINQ